MAEIKCKIIENYLQQQMKTCGPGSCEYDSMDHAIQPIEIPDDNTLAEFKQQVRMWIETDNMIKKMHEAIKERNCVKKALTTHILAFMSKYNIEDLNTREGKLRFKMSQTKQPLTQKMIKEKVKEHFNMTTSCDELMDKVFQVRDKQAVPTLRRVKITSR